MHALRPCPLLCAALLAGVLAWSRAPAAAADSLVTVIATLDEPPVATYAGGVSGLAATSPAATRSRHLALASSAVVAYRTHLARRMTEVESRIAQAIPAARVLHRYDVVLGGLAVQLPASEVGKLQDIAGVSAVYPDEQHEVIKLAEPTFVGAPALWRKVGGESDAGEGMIIGLIDSGVWPEHPSFSDPDPAGKPYTVPPGTRACDFSSGANPGPPFACNGKLIGAYRFLTTGDACAACPHPAAEFTSARDGDGHGTMTATIAAGNAGVTATLLGIERGIVSGIAPRAHIIEYKVCAPTATSCVAFDSDVVDAVQQAVLDGVDVINFSIHGSGDPYFETVSLAFRDANAAGIFVAAGAGNDGPAPDTITQLAPWVTTVAASTVNRAFENKAVLAAADRAKLKLVGHSISPAIKPALPVVLASSVGDEFCASATADGAFTGSIVACNDRLGAQMTSFDVAQRGASGLLLYGDDALGDTPFVPEINLAGAALATFLQAHAGVTATFGKPTAVKARGDVMGDFSSRGGPHGAFGVSKPDLTAPGVEVLAGDTPAHYVSTQPNGELFQVSYGTSFATPQVAGAAALLKQLHPAWTPGQIRSALMTTASAAKLVKEDGTTPFDAFDAGSGRIALKSALDPGLTFDASTQDYVDHAADLWTVNYPSLFLPTSAPNVVSVMRTAHGELAKDATWALKLATPPDVVIGVPATLSVPSGGAAPFTIMVDKSAVPAGEARFATLTLSARGHVARFPITVVGSAPLPDLIVTDFSISGPVTIGGAVDFSVTVKNVGTVDAAASVATLLVSADAALDANDEAFIDCSFDPIAAGVSSTCSGPLPFTPEGDVLPGQYWVFAVADYRGQVSEANEQNNVFLAASQITVN